MSKYIVMVEFVSEMSMMNRKLYIVGKKNYDDENDPINSELRRGEEIFDVKDTKI